MKKFMLLFALIAIVLLPACMEDTGVDPSCIPPLDPFYYNQVDGNLGYITATTTEYSLDLTFTIYLDKRCRIIRDSTRPKENGEYPYMTLWMNGKENWHFYNPPFGPGNHHMFGETEDYCMPGGSKDYFTFRDDTPDKPKRGIYGWSFKSQNPETGEIFIHNGEIKYSQHRPNTEWWRL